MLIQLNITQEDATRIFESHGLEVVNFTTKKDATLHGSTSVAFKSTELVVINPNTRERISLHNATQRLMTRKMATELLWMDKMQVLDALSCQPLELPFKRVFSHHETINL